MNRPLRAALLAVVVVVVVDAAFRLVAPSLPEPLIWSSEEAQAKVARMEDLAGRVDVAVVGSSVVDLGFDPAAEPELGAYNAALRGASAEVIARWTADVVVPRLDPQTVVIGVTSRELSPNDTEQIGATRDFLAAPAMRRLLGTETVMNGAERQAGRVSAIFRYRTVLRRPLLIFEGRDRLDSGVELSASGWDRSQEDTTYQDSEGVKQFFRSVPLRDFAVGTREQDRFETLAKALRSRGKDVVILNMPVTEDYIDLHPRKRTDYEAATAALRRVAERAGARFVDAGVWPSRFFSDPIHLNGDGASKLTGEVALELART